MIDDTTTVDSNGDKDDSDEEEKEEESKEEEKSEQSLFTKQIKSLKHFASIFGELY